MSSDSHHDPEKIPFRLRRLGRPSMYRTLMSHGRSLRRSPVTLRYYQPDEPEISRVGFIIRKTVGKANRRNCLRRVLRAVFQNEFERLSQPTWVIFEVSKDAWQLTRRQFRDVASELFAELVGRENKEECSKK